MEVHEDVSPTGQGSESQAARRTCILVLGMHRSGTSALTRVLSLLGAALPKNVLGADENNETGHWEPERLVALHDEMLMEAGSRWYDWRAFDPSVLGAERLAHYKSEISRLIFEEYGDAPLFVLKDPRICRFVPFYEEVFAKLGIDLRFVLTVRNPVAVSESLRVRNGMRPDCAALLWLRHMLDAEGSTGGRKRIIIHYEELLADWRTSLFARSSSFGISDLLDQSAASAIDAFLTTDLQHQKATPEPPSKDVVSQWVSQVYLASLALARDPEDKRAIQTLAEIRNDLQSETFPVNEAGCALGDFSFTGFPQNATLRTGVDVGSHSMYRGRHRTSAVASTTGSHSVIDVSVVIPYHNQTHWLLMCLSALSRTTAGNLREIIVVNDNSNSSEVEFLKSRIADPRVVVIDNVSRRGFGGACNFGWKEAAGDLVLFLNTDCLIAPNTIAEMSGCISQSDKVGLVSVLTNHAEEMRFPIFPGLSYIDMSELLADVSQSGPKSVDVRAAEGHCLMVAKQLLLQTGGFSPDWGLGYGEETDLHFNAKKLGYRSVVSLSTYVYHHGKQSFTNNDEFNLLREKNFLEFMKRWGSEYKQSHHLSYAGPRAAEKAISEKYGALSCAGYDILFVLPGYNQGVGGIQSVFDFINELILSGFRANCVLLSATELSDAEARLFTPLCSDDIDIVSSIVKADVICTTHHSTIPFGIKLALQLGAEHINYAQGVETYFEKGIEAITVARRLNATKRFIANSSWTASLIKAYAPEAEVRIGFPYIPAGLFLDRKLQRQFDLTIVLRSAPDKGQGKLMDMLGRLSSLDREISIVVLASPEYFRSLKEGLENGSSEAVTVCRQDFVRGKVGSVVLYLKALPFTRTQISSVLDASRVFVDCSDHEGFGLLAAEAALSGAYTICSDSGGFTRDFAGFCEVLPSGPEFSLALVDSIQRALGAPQEHASSPKTLRYPHNSFVELLTEQDLSVEENPSFKPMFKPSGSRADRKPFTTPLAPGPTWKYKVAKTVWRRMPRFAKVKLARLVSIINRIDFDAA